MGTRLYDHHERVVGIARDVAAILAEPARWTVTLDDGSQILWTEYPDGTRTAATRPSKWDTWGAPFQAERADQ